LSKRFRRTASNFLWLRIFNIWYRIRIRIFKPYIYDGDIQSYHVRHFLYYLYLNPNPDINMKTNTISAISVRIRSVFIPTYGAPCRCFPASRATSRGVCLPRPILLCRACAWCNYITLLPLLLLSAAWYTATVGRPFGAVVSCGCAHAACPRVYNDSVYYTRMPVSIWPVLRPYSASSQQYFFLTPIQLKMAMETRSLIPRGEFLYWGSGMEIICSPRGG
jgi:hypothetical protein